MYNDLSQSSQETDSISMSMDTQSSDVPIIAIKSCFSLAKEEDALLEPPVVLQQPEVLNELPITLDNGPSAGIFHYPYFYKLESTNLDVFKEVPNQQKEIPLITSCRKI